MDTQSKEPQHASTSQRPFSLLEQTDAHPATQAPKSKIPSKDIRRIRGEIACAECRRLKIRCDRMVPCSTCIKRGCAALCPNGTIPPGEGSRFVLAATDHLRHKLSRLEARMHSLEDAIAILHNSESDQPHPFLSVREETEEDISTLQPISEEKKNLPSETPGMLWMDKQGGSRFFGASGGSESLLMSSELSASHSPIGPILQELDPSYLSAEINQCYQAFPFTPPNVIASSVQVTIESFLPPVDRAIALCDTFLEHLSWMFHVVSRRKLVNELIPIIYKQTSISYGPHDLALLLIVLGIGSLVDLQSPPYNLEAQHYYRLSRATLALQPVLGAQSMVTIKVLHLMSIYNGMSGKESNLEQSYILLDLAGQVALRIGFHIDPSMWGLEGREAYDRRVYFWNLMAGVLWQSLVTGRPPSLLTSYIDCRIPTAQDEDLYQEGEVPLGFGIWGFKASVECLVPLTRLIISAKPPSYEDIIALDRKIRDLARPAKDQAEGQEDRTAISMKIFVRSHYQDLMLLFLHRAHFAQAMMEHPDDPLQSPYSFSVKTAYASACAVLEDTKTQFMKKPLLCSRVWKIWSFTFSAAVIVGTIAIRGVHLNFNPPPLEEFEAIFNIFIIAAEISSRAARATPLLQLMLDKARQAHDYYHRQGKLPPKEQHDMDELSFFGGRTGFVQQQKATKDMDIEEWRPDDHPFLEAGQAKFTHAADEHYAHHPQRPPSESHSYHGSARPQTGGPSSQAVPVGVYQYPSSYDRAHTPNHASFSMHPGSRQHESFADLSGGWGGTFQEIPGPLYDLDQHRHPRFDPQINDHAQALHPQRQQQEVLGEGVMLDDRWASFMTYNVLRETTHHYRQP